MILLCTIVIDLSHKNFKKQIDKYIDIYTFANPYYTYRNVQELQNPPKNVSANSIKIYFIWFLSNF